MTSRPVGQEGHCFLVVDLHPGHWNGDVATRVDMRTTKVKFFTKYLSEGMNDPGKIIRPGQRCRSWGGWIPPNISAASPPTFGVGRSAH